MTGGGYPVERSSRSVRRGKRGLAVAVVLVLGCVGSSSPWYIPKGAHDRFRQARKVCHELTDTADGPAPELFDTCMERRGWRRERFYDRWLG